jgi:hypothetical protein
MINQRDMIEKIFKLYTNLALTIKTVILLV